MLTSKKITVLHFIRQPTEIAQPVRGCPLSFWLMGKPILVGRDGPKGMLLSVSQRNMSLTPCLGTKVIAPVG